MNEAVAAEDHVPARKRILDQIGNQKLASVPVKLLVLLDQRRYDVRTHIGDVSQVYRAHPVKVSTWDIEETCHFETTQEIRQRVANVLSRNKV
jgi:hypothetical protein